MKLQILIYAVRNAKGETKVIHHDLIKPAGVNRIASVTTSNVLSETPDINLDWRTGLPTAMTAAISNEISLVPTQSPPPTNNVTPETLPSSLEPQVDNAETEVLVDVSDFKPLSTVSAQKTPSLVISKTKVDPAKLRSVVKRSSARIRAKTVAPDAADEAVIKDVLGDSSSDDEGSVDRADPDYMPDVL